PPAPLVAAEQRPAAPVARGQSPDPSRDPGGPPRPPMQLASVPRRQSIYQRVGSAPPPAAATPAEPPQRTATSATSKVMW
ncbi:MAG: hypothetical protein O2946_10995, partial [Planctomycetota bacterium]|nr:hypothetical protein [Planctomycetota bacterium]